MIVYKKPERVHLFGGGSVMAAFHGWLVSQGFTVYAYTAPRQADGSDQIVVEDINAHFELAFVQGIGPTDLAICFGPAWKFGTFIRNGFGNRLIDFMSIPYPSYLGGAHISWARMMGETKWGCCMQLVTENTVQGECHDGEVIWQDAFPFVESELEGRYLEFLKGFMHTLCAEGSFRPVVVDETARFHLPRLNTQQQGWVNWSWCANEIRAFIQAFDKPYSGARSAIEGHWVSLHDPGYIPSKMWHPYQSGIIIGRHGDDWLIIAGRTLMVATVVVRDDSGFEIKPGMRLRNASAILEHSLGYKPNYTATGDANAR